MKSPVRSLNLSRLLSRRLGALGISWLASAFVAFTAPTALSADLGIERFYIGTQTFSGSLGIYQSSLNLDAATLGASSLAVATTSPTFLATTPDHKFLYAVNEPTNSVSAFSVDASTGALTLLNSVAADGAGPTHLAVDRTGKQVIVANYTSGSITMFPLLADGRLGTSNAHFQYASGSNAHCATIDANSRFVFICDLGLDQIHSYALDAAAGTLTPSSVPTISIAAGSGPRHLAFNPANTRAYLICELNSTIVGFNFNSINGTLSPFQTLSTLPAGFGGANSTAEIVVHPSGKFVYGSNRGHNSIAVFSVNAADGTLTPIQHQPTGPTPRNFAIDPTGKFCLVASQDGATVALYNINPQTGLLSSAGQSLSVSRPVCILPYLVQPPQPTLSIQSVDTDTFRLSIGNTLEVLTYRVFETPSLTEPNWRLLQTGIPGQATFDFDYTLPERFFRVEMLNNY